MISYFHDAIFLLKQLFIGISFCPKINVRNKINRNVMNAWSKNTDLLWILLDVDSRALLKLDSQVQHNICTFIMYVHCKCLLGLKTYGKSQENCIVHRENL